MATFSSTLRKTYPSSSHKYMTNFRWPQVCFLSSTDAGKRSILGKGRWAVCTWWAHCGWEADDGVKQTDPTVRKDKNKSKRELTSSSGIYCITSTVRGRAFGWPYTHNEQKALPRGITGYKNSHLSGPKRTGIVMTMEMSRFPYHIVVRRRSNGWEFRSPGASGVSMDIRNNLLHIG